MKSTFFFGKHGGWRNATGVAVNLSNQDILCNKIDGLLHPKATTLTLIKSMGDKTLRHSYMTRAIERMKGYILERVPEMLNDLLRLSKLA